MPQVGGDSVEGPRVNHAPVSRPLVVPTLGTHSYVLQATYGHIECVLLGEVRYVIKELANQYVMIVVYYRLVFGFTLRFCCLSF
jgi:hypothetical protein